MLPLVIVNPKSAAGSTRKNWVENVADLRTHFGQFNVAFTKRQGDGIELAKHAAESGRKFIIACGGDGTINEIANGILESGEDVEMGILPSGTGGDFRRTIGMPTNMRKAATALKNGTTKRIDAGRVTFSDFKNETVRRYFVNVASFGLSASIIKRVKSGSAFKWLPNDLLRGKAGFAVSTLREVVGVEPLNIRVKIDEREEKNLLTVNFCVCNSRYFGGGMKIAPEAKIDDGCFDVVNVGDIRTAKILLNSYRLYSGSHLHLDEVKNLHARRIEVRPSDNTQQINLEIDGELPGKLPAVFEIIPTSLKIRMPYA